MKKLIDPNDDQLNAAFAEMVAGYSVKQLRGNHTGALTHLMKGDKQIGFEFGHVAMEAFAPSLPRFTSSADAVLPWLEKAVPVKIQSWSTNEWWVTVDRPAFADEFATTFPKAAVLALLKAHGGEIELTRTP